MPCDGFPKWDIANERQSVESLYEWAVKKAHDQIHWYEAKRLPQKNWSQGVRWSALILATIGALCPLVAPVFSELKIVWLKLPELGYVFLAIGAAFVTFDRYYGFSSSWMRYASSQVTLDITLKEFQYDWFLLQSQPFSASGSIQKIKEFSAKVDGIIKQETDAWLTEFRNNLAELEKMLKTGAEAKKPGSIKLTVANARDFESVSIALDGGFIKEIKGVTETLLDFVPPGCHEVTAIGRDDAGAEHKESKVVDVSPDGPVVLEINITK